MGFRPFCNKCAKTNPTELYVTSCRHVICATCHQRPKCRVCKTVCKVIPFQQLPEEMAVYFQPLMPSLKKYLKIAKFQLQQRSLWTTKGKAILERLHDHKRTTAMKKQQILQLRQGYKEVLEHNAQLKRQLQRARRTEPQNPFEMNSHRNLSPDDVQSVPTHALQRNRHEVSINSRSSSNSFSRGSLSSHSNRSSAVGQSPPLNVTPRRMSSTVNTSIFFNASDISASSSLNSTTSRTGQIRNMLKNSNLRSC